VAGVVCALDRLAIARGRIYASKLRI